MNKRRFKLKITEKPMKSSDREFMAKGYEHIKKLTKLASKADKDLKPIFSAEIQKLRNDIRSEYAQKFYIVEVGLGPHKNSKVFSYSPEITDINEIKNELLQRISKGRAEARQMNLITKEFQGMNYQVQAPMNRATYKIERIQVGQPGTVPKVQFVGPTKPMILPGLLGGGATFQKPGSVLALMKGPQYSERIHRAKRPYDKSNFVGVELELISKANRETLNRLFIEAKLAGTVYVKGDSSIRVETPGDHAHEVTLIAKEEHINEVILKVCEVLNKPEVSAYVNNTCGLHVHLDMRNRSPEICYNNFYRAKNVLGGMVPPDRVDTDWSKRYCNLECPETFKRALEEGQRYKAINAMSYHSHSTIEIRLHSGSTNARKINHWVNVLMAIVRKTDKVEVIVPIDDMQRVFGISDATLDFIKMRTKKFEDRSWDTRKDHFAVEAAV
jgi:hypothetical protein